MKDLYRDGDITLYASAVVAKDKAGKIGILGGPAGLQQAPRLAALLTELNDTG